jgi:hypothetical protein
MLAGLRQARGPRRLELTGVASYPDPNGMLAHPLEGLVPRFHHEALAVLIGQLELLHSGSLARLLVWCLNNPDVLGRFPPGTEIRQ